MNILKYNGPAKFWEEALPLGNGRFGAMVFGGADRERIELNEDTIWSGRPDEETGYRIREDIDKVRELLRDGKYSEANVLTDEMTGSHDSQSYQPAGSMYLDFPKQGAVTDYHRELDISTAVTSVCFERNGVAFSRESFISAPHQVMAIKLSADSPGSITFDISMDSVMRHECRTAGKDVVFNGQCPFSNHSWGEDDVIWEQDGRGGMKYVVKTTVLNEGGTVSAEGDLLRVADADSVVLLVAVQTGFVSWDCEPSDDLAKMEEECDLRLAAASREGWQELKAAHVSEYSSIYQRMTLDLGAKDDRCTDEILETCSGPADNPALVNLVFNYGRYLLISSSRPGTQPANLQGIWQHKLIAPWRCNYTTNINAEMNYWPSETCNLADCGEPFLRFVRETAESGRRPAQTLYGARGWCLHHNSDLWRYSYTGGNLARHAFWPVGGAWICQHLWEHFAFSGDREFLAEALPLMKDAAAFFIDFMIENADGKLVTSPSTSPENRFLDPAANEPASVCEGSAMDMTMIRELFENIIEGSTILGETDGLVDEIKSACARLAMPKIGTDGRLLEFGIEADEVEPKHRHVSHLYGVYPGWTFTPGRNADLYEACRKSLDARGDKSTGWAMGWRVALWARLRDGNRTLNVIGDLLCHVNADADQNMSDGGGLYANLFDAHPPFQIDGNFGVTAGIAEMLVQSHEVEDGKRVIELLPALPDAWSSGAISGLRARGGLVVTFDWHEGKPQNVIIKASQDSDFILKCDGKAAEISLAAGKEFRSA